MSRHEHPCNVIIMLKGYDTSSFLFSMMPNSNIHRENRDSLKLTLFHLKHQYFKNSFFPYETVECNKSSSLFLTRDYGEYLIRVLIFIGPKINSVYEIHNPP